MSRSADLKTLALLALLPTCVCAEDVTQGQREKTAPTETLTIIGTPSDLAAIPGSGQIVTQEEITQSRAQTVDDVLRKVPGAYPRGEEGLGMRPNIGFRGLNPTRSSKVLLLEDGIPLSYAPYGDNASYYHPPLARFERVEVLKGSGQIAFGPHTVGGIINYITPEIPEESAGFVQASAGNLESHDLQAGFGTTVGRTGIATHVQTRQADGARAHIRLRFHDANLKLRQQLNDDQALVLRLSYFEEDSDLPYSGLTRAEFQADPRQNPFINDDFETHRIGVSLTHQAALNANLELTTNLYYSHFQREWWRQSSNSGQRPNDASDPACGGMANLNTGCGNEGRLRNYDVYGLEPRVHYDFAALGGQHRLNTGLRAHFERQSRKQHNGDSPHARLPGTGVNGGVIEDNRRGVQAYSGFVENASTYGRVTFTPGVRLEHIRYTRENRLTGIEGTAPLTEVIPGAGVNVDAGAGVTLFAGAHRGFAPPGVADIIGNNGGSADLDAETSWNYEAGARAQILPGLRAEGTFFHMDFDNQIIPQSVAGGVGATLTSAGETTHQGFESLLRLDSAPLLHTGAHNVFFQTAHTWLPVARFDGARFSSVTGFATTSVSGNRLPYAPEHLVSATLGYEWLDVFSAEIEGVYTGGMFADDLNTIPVSANGQRGRIERALIWNAALNYSPPETALTFFLSARNLTDKTVVVDRTRGAIPNMPLWVQAGVIVRY